jgi:hypothetical protein
LLGWKAEERVMTPSAKINGEINSLAFGQWFTIQREI